MKMSGSGKIIIGVAADYVEAILSGSGCIELNGSSANFESVLSGLGSIKVKKLKTELGKFTVSGSGRIKANISDKLEARISDSGSIGYQGSCSTQVHSKVSGSLCKRNERVLSLIFFRNT